MIRSSISSRILWQDISTIFLVDFFVCLIVITIFTNLYFCPFSIAFTWWCGIRSSPGCNDRRIVHEGWVRADNRERTWRCERVRRLSRGRQRSTQRRVPGAAAVAEDASTSVSGCKLQDSNRLCYHDEDRRREPAAPSPLWPDDGVAPIAIDSAVSTSFCVRIDENSKSGFQLKILNH